jgi:hypothetical protein
MLERYTVPEDSITESQVNIKEKIESFRLSADKKGFSKESPFKKGAFVWTQDEDKILTEAALIIPNGLSGFLTIDDESLYPKVEETRDDILKKFEKETNRRKNAMIVQAVLIDYFGISGNHERRRDLYDSLDIDDVASIKAFNKEKNVAACAERSAVVQNLYAFLGLKSYMIAGECDINEHSKGELHAFTLIKDEDGYAIFDSTNPIITKDNNGETVGLAPAVYTISREQLNILLQGDQSGVSVIHNNFEIDAFGEKKVVSTEIRVYRVSERIKEIDKNYTTI